MTGKDLFIALGDISQKYYDEAENDTAVRRFKSIRRPLLIAAAIAMALHLYYADIHDNEAHVMTIKKVERRYSPWNSKIYGINNLVK